MTIKLNEDVLYETFGACPIPTLTSICLVSTLFYRVALPHLLQDVTFKRNPALLVRFLYFIINNSTAVTSRREDPTGETSIQRLKLFATDPGKHVHSIQLHETLVFETISGGAISQLLTKAVALMPNLRSATIRSSVEWICLSSPDFFSTLLSRPQLHSLTFGSFGRLSSQALGEAVRSRRSEGLRLKSIRFDDGLDFDSDDPHSFVLTRNDGLGSLIFSCREYLEELNVGMCNLKDLLVQSQTLPDGSTGLTRSIVYPNVARLHFRSSPEVSVEDFALSFPFIRSLRCRNFATFEESHTLRGNHKPLLRHLVSLDCLYFPDALMILNCIDPAPPLRRLSLSTSLMRPITDNASLSVAERVLRGVRIFHIELHCISDLTTWEFFKIRLSSVTYLDFVFSFRNEEQSRLEDVQDLDLFSSLPLAYLSTSFVLRSVSGDPLRIKSVALSYARNIRTLKFLDVCEKNYNRIEHSVEGRYWWKVIRTVLPGSEEQDVRLEALTEAAGRRIRDEIQFSLVPDS
ncbi:hypothetical protein CVT26_001041 [Gymnopilus dilepis]|uniref:F-box domain-containing protein n=1 Tax=Gymnopilus dilepis TaxID=231916 RepID=A0A409WLF0_9AGAR|nr:hypothetical protein CVT26_001041 [Gymnopilus dilepis]